MDGNGALGQYRRGEDEGREVERGWGGLVLLSSVQNYWLYLHLHFLSLIGTTKTPNF